MKQLIFILAILMFASTQASSKAVLSGKTNTFLNDYQITQTGENLYELSYSNSTEKFTIEVCPKEAECCYLVRSNKVEVMYLCNNAGFGLRKMPEKQRQLETSEYCKLVNCKAFMYQSLISQNKKSTEKALGLIACFFPEVVNETCRATVFNPALEKVNSKLEARR